MDKGVLKKFAVESRFDLVNKIGTKIKEFYVEEEFDRKQNGDVYILSNENHIMSLSKEQFDKRELLIKRVKELGLNQVIEEAAYTWFNRIIAIRYMEINDYLPLTKNNQSLGIRILSSKDNCPDPEIMKFTNLINPELDINFKKEKYVNCKENEKYPYILLLVCGKIGRVIPQVFDGITDYIDILIPDNLLNDTGFITKLINEIPEKYFYKTEIIGWLYQYYNQSEKDRVITAKKVYKKNEIPFATQLFTPDWIVKYMVENSLGKYWIENTNAENLKNFWDFYIKNDSTDGNVNKKILPTEITFFDPCCGSGHILLYAFDVFFKIYESSGYNKTDIPELILKNNLFGLDIDDRAGQLSVLSILLKAREYDKNIFNKDTIKDLNIMSIKESSDMLDFAIDSLSFNLKEKSNYLQNIFSNAKELGSLIKVEPNNYLDLLKYINSEITIETSILKEYLIPLIKQAEILSNKYNVVVTNPPYMGEKYFSPTLKNYIRTNYAIGKSDMFSSFMLVCKELAKENSYIGMITPYAWMFLDSYKDLRNFLINNMPISSLIQLEFNAFEVAALPVCTFILKKCSENLIGNYIKLSDFTGSENQPIKALEAINNRDVYYFYQFQMQDFNKINDKPFAYWISDSYKSVFEKATLLREYAIPRQGMATTDNKRFMRNWFEVDINNIKFFAKNSDEAKKSNRKWFPYNKGGRYRKWYGNNDFIVNYYNDGEELINLVREKYPNISDPEFVIKNRSSYFRAGITWTFISIDVGVRYFPNGFIFDVAGSSLFPEERKLYYILGFMCSKLMKQFLQMLNPTMNVQAGNVANLPIIFDEEKENTIINCVKECIEISKNDWDNYETSWDFKNHPLIKATSSIIDSFNKWSELANYNFEKLRNNEEALNQIFIDIYGLNKDLSNTIEDKDVTVKKANLERDIKSLISYAVGCMFGRYSLDEDGLIYAGGEFDSSKYKTFKADEDNIIPITDELYFNDDIVNRFKQFIEVVYGKETLNENLDYIAETLGKKGTETSEDTIRRYFVNDFYNDHIKTYQKRPIYWLFDSGKKNGFKCLIYMHRYSKDLVATIRTKYIPKVQTTYEKLLSDVEYRLSTELSLNDKKEMEKKKIELNGKIQEVKEYYEKIANVANRMIDIDLDDGVVINYAKFTYLNPKTNKEESILGKIK